MAQARLRASVATALPRRASPPRVVRERHKVPGPLRTFAPIGFGYFAAFADVVCIFAAAWCADLISRFSLSGDLPHPASVAAVGTAVALVVVGVGVQRGEYNLQSYQHAPGQTSRAFASWALALMVILTLGFATERSPGFSRAAMAIFAMLGYLSLLSSRRAMVDLAHLLLRTGVVEPRRLVIVGFEDRLHEIAGAKLDFGSSMELVAMIALRDHQAYLTDDLSLAAAAVRMHRVDDICLAVPWSRHEVIEVARATFMSTPAEIHLDADRLLEQLGQARFSRLGAISGLRITRPRLTHIERFEKRLFDLGVALCGLIALSPILLAIALAIRLESRGPALFRQTRYGFNQEPFRIFKFRTMRTMEDGAKVVAAKRGDARVTRLGAYLRRFSIDEIPQLLNVVRGEMSIVGPRPHAMAHDQRYVDRLSRYARRHNVKPGITGWAQVHGHRGEISDDQAMLGRLEHDLYYVDNWSLWLDVKIVLMTVFSSKAHSNAF